MLKQKIIEDVRACAEKFERLFTFTVKNMRNIHMKDVRHQWSHSRFFFGKNKVMVLALGKSKDDEYLDGLHHVSVHLHGETGLLFTNKPKKEVLEFFKKYRAADFARSGNVATETVILKEGPLPGFQHSMEPQLRQLGLPTSLNRGVITLLHEHTVCKKGEVLSPEKARILKLLGHTMADFTLTATGMWTKDGQWEDLSRQSKAAKNNKAVKNSTSKKAVGKKAKSKKSKVKAMEMEVAEDSAEIENEDESDENSDIGSDT